VFVFMGLRVHSRSRIDLLAKRRADNALIKIGPGFAAFASLVALAQIVKAADHGPVFGLATPTNPQGGWSFDLGVNERSGLASVLY